MKFIGLYVMATCHVHDVDLFHFVLAHMFGGNKKKKKITLNIHIG